MAKYAIVKILDEKAATWGEISAEYLRHAESYKAPATLHYVDHPTVRSLGAFFSKNEISSESADAWAKHIRSKMCLTSARTRIVTARLIFRHAVKKGMIDANPFEDVPVPKPRDTAGRFLTDDELSRFLALLPDRQRRACLLALHHGFRRKEVVTLQWDQITDKSIIIPPSLSKNRKGRTVWLHPKAAEFLGPRGTGSVFRMSEEALGRPIVDAWRKLGIGRIRFHDMRHTWATNFWEATKDLWLLMDQGGWTNPKACKVYQHGKPNASCMAVVNYDLPRSIGTSTPA